MHSLRVLPSAFLTLGLLRAVSAVVAGVRERQVAGAPSGLITSGAHITLNATDLALNIPPAVFWGDESDDPTTSSDIDTLNALVAPDSNGPGRQLIQDPIHDIVRSGNYHIYGCGAGNRGGHADRLLQMLPQIWTDLQATLADIGNNGLSSRFGASALFKTQANLDIVQSVFEKISDGQIVTRKDISGNLQAFPMILCADERKSDMISSWVDHCALKPGLMGWQKTGGNLVVLCPDFWRLPLYEAPNSKFCPYTIGNQVVLNSPVLQQDNRRSVLIHSLSHMYMPNSGQDFLHPEVDKLGDAITLNAASQIRNPGNYAFYYASVVAGCTNWPRFA